MCLYQIQLPHSYEHLTPYHNDCKQQKKKTCTHSKLASFSKMSANCHCFALWKTHAVMQNKCKGRASACRQRGTVGGWIVLSCVPFMYFRKPGTEIRVDMFCHFPCMWIIM